MTKVEGNLKLLVSLALVITGASITLINMEKQISIWFYLSNQNEYSNETFYVNSSSQQHIKSGNYYNVLHGFIAETPVSRSLHSISRASDLDLQGLKNGETVLEVPVLFAQHFKGRWKGVLNGTDDVSVMNVSYASMTYLDAIIFSFFCNIPLAVAAIYMWSQRKNFYFKKH